MALPSNEIVDLTLELVNDLACSGLTRSFARLYGQYTRLQENQSGLPSWTDDESTSRLNDSVQLIEASLIQRQVNDDRWRDGMRRSGELLEWLSLPELNPEHHPIRLLAGATYQLAGYPARASGLFRARSNDVESDILASLFKADFVSLLERLTRYWSVSHRSQQERIEDEDPDNSFNTDIHSLVVRETVSCLGIICAYMRWGDESRIQRAIDKLSSVKYVMVYERDPFSWLLSKLCAEVAGTYFHSSMRQLLAPLAESFNQAGRVALERYIRQGYSANKALMWLSQMRGVERLQDNQSFALCTPTGSGKTTIAEIAILQSLFSQNQLLGTEPLVMYLVPSRALAAEVESKLSRVMKRVAPPAQPVIVTGLYGGTDWGPTDVWFTSNSPTVLICTYEKAEALMKFLGTRFLNRVSLVVIDEAHNVQFDGNSESLQKSENRALRLEALGARIFSYLDDHRSRIIALSAVASGSEAALAQWVSHQSEGEPTTINYRSTRQIIGRLGCAQRNFVIQYDLLDGSNLEFEEENRTRKPYVVRPFPAHPQTPNEFRTASGTQKRLCPYLLWAAMHLASPNERGEQRAVLISITENINTVSIDFLTLINAWADAEKPDYFPQPTGFKLNLWQKSLNSCADYYGTNSREYQLLQKGIVIHHGKMPGLMARHLLELIEYRIINLVVATTTLSEGVNLPFETVLIPSLIRSNRQIPLREFSNTVGRAGRPGVSTEGKCFVLLLGSDSSDWNATRDRNSYRALINEISNPEQSSANNGPESPLAALIAQVHSQWRRIQSQGRNRDFFNWLEVTAPNDFNGNSGPEFNAIESLDSLDSILLASIVELELIAARQLSVDELEENLQRIWRRTYAHVANQEEQRLQQIFLHRGRALINSVYTNSTERRRLYRTSLPPRSGSRLLELYPQLKEYLQTGLRYAEWSQNEKFEYIRGIVNLVNTIPQFEIQIRTRIRTFSWSQILKWWLCHSTAQKKPETEQIYNCHKYINKNFTYRFNWGLGSVISLVMDETSNGQETEPSFENWSLTGLPWIAFWLKELIIWGTLDPVAAYLLARVNEITTRQEAESRAQDYYSNFISLDPNELLNAANIQTWVQQIFPENRFDRQAQSGPRTTQVTLLQDFNNTSKNTFRVVPVEIDSQIFWFDPAGFELARNSRPEDWQSQYLNNYDFTLNVSELTVTPRRYI